MHSIGKEAESMSDGFNPRPAVRPGDALGL